MKQDNEWNEGFVCQRSDDKSFVLVDNLEEIKDDRPWIIEDGGIKYQDVRYNWNKGQPIVDFGDFKMCITDIGWLPIIKEEVV